MQFIRVIDFEKLQHYRDRKPPWIKLYRDLLSDDRLFELSEADRYQLIGLFLLASHHDNKIPNKSGWLRKELGVNRAISLQNLIDNGWIELVEQDASGLLHASDVLAEAERVATPRALAREETEKRRDREETEKTVPPTAKRADLAADLFADSYKTQIGNPYGWKPGDFPQLVKLRKRLGIDTWETPDGWNDALVNYFASPFSKFSLQHFASDFDTFKNSPLDRYGKPINHLNGGNGNGSRKETDAEKNNRAVKNAIDRSMAAQVRSDVSDVWEDS